MTFANASPTNGRALVISPRQALVAWLIAGAMQGCARQPDKIIAPTAVPQVAIGKILTSKVTVINTSCHANVPCATQTRVSVVHKEIELQASERGRLTQVSTLRNNLQSNIGSGAIGKARSATVKKVEDDGVSFLIEHEGAGSTWSYSASFDGS